MSRGYTLDTRPVPSASKRVFDRGGRQRRNWRQVYGLRRKNPYYLLFFGKMKSLYLDQSRNLARGAM